MSSRGGLTLAQRSALSAGRGLDEVRDVEAAAVRHCWVDDLPGTPGRCPGLLAEWSRRAGGGWFGRVVYAVDDAGRVVLVEAWIPARFLTPAGS